MIDGYKDYKTNKGYVYFVNPMTGKQNGKVYVYTINNDASFKRAFDKAMKEAQRFYEKNF
jgi:hypothetical protein